MSVVQTDKEQGLQVPGRGRAAYLLFTRLISESLCAEAGHDGLASGGCCRETPPKERESGQLWENSKIKTNIIKVDPSFFFFITKEFFR